MSAEWDCEYCGHSNLGSSCPCGRPNESDELKLQLSHLQKLCEEQKVELKNKQQIILTDNQLVASLESQLATQAERVKLLENELTHAAKRDHSEHRNQHGDDFKKCPMRVCLGYRQALNQESLGDGGKGCQ